MENASSPREHLDHLDGLRALLALYVVQRHVEVATWNVTERDSRFSLLYFFRSAHFAVDVFIVISGFCLFLPVLRNAMGPQAAPNPARAVPAHRALSIRGGTATFLKRRAIRILPPYYAAFALSMLALTLVGDTNQFTGKNAPTIWHHLLLVHDALSPVLVNAALWSVAVEVHIYLLFPLLVLTWRRWGAAAAFAWAVPLAGVLAYLVNHTRYAVTSPHYLILFMFGMVGAFLYASPTRQFTMGPQAAPNPARAELAQSLFRKVPWSVIGIVLILSCFILRSRRFPIVPIDLLVGVGGACLLLGGSVPGLLRRLLCWRPLVFIGRFSYSLYLIHLPVLFVVLRIAHPLHLAQIEGARRLPVLVALAAIATAAAYAFYWIAERPFLSGAQRRPDEAPAAGQTAA